MKIVKVGFLRKKTIAIAFWPFIFADKYRVLSENLIRHENIHGKQQKELLLIFFYIWYFGEYFIRFLKYKNHDKAYRNICFEREAYGNANIIDYLDKRKPWSFTKYL